MQLNYSFRAGRKFIGFLLYPDRYAQKILTLVDWKLRNQKILSFLKVKLIQLLFDILYFVILMPRRNAQTQQIQLSKVQLKKSKKKPVPKIDLKLSTLSFYTLNNVYSILRSIPPKQIYLFTDQTQKQSNFIIDPETKFVGLWNFIIIFVVYFICFQISLILGFGPEFWDTELQNPVYLYIYIGLVSMLIIDLVVNFNKGYYIFGEGRSVMNRTKIIAKYVTTQFILDVISIGMLVLLLLKNDYYLNFLQLFTIILLHIKKYKYQVQVKNILIPIRTLQSAFIITMLSCDGMLLANYAGLIFMGGDILLWKLQYFGNNSRYYWLSNNSFYANDLLPGAYIPQYVYAMAWSIGTLSTLAPGPFGKNPIEDTYEIFIMIAFMVFASYVAEVLLSVVYVAKTPHLFHGKNIFKFNTFMLLKKVGSKVRDKVSDFFQLLSDYQIKIYSQQSQVLLKRLPNLLQQDVISQMSFSNQLRLLKEFSNFGELSKSIAYKIKKKIFDPGATIFSTEQKLDSVEEKSIIFIKRGIALFSMNTNKKYKKIISLSNNKKTLCQYEFITGLSYAFNCRSIDLCIIQRVSFTDIFQILKNLNLQEEYFYLRCKVLYQNKLELLRRQCFICQGQHRQNSCPQICPKKMMVEEMKDSQLLKKKIHKNQVRRKLKRKDHRNLESNKIVIRIQKRDRLFLVEKQLKLYTKRNQLLGRTIQLDSLQQYEKYFPHFNLQQ